MTHVISLAFRFAAGRYHATPWGRHVNEADVEWPPSPWRIVRALIAVYWRKADRGRFSVDDLGGLIEALASCLPVYRLPDATHAHARHYMPTREGTTLVFDAFARIDSTETLSVAWRGLTLSPRSAELLAHLAPLLGYLGRAEAWVDCEVRDDDPDVFADEAAGRLWSPHQDSSVSGGAGNVISLLAPLSIEQWRAERARHVAAMPAEKKRGKSEKAVAAVLHEQLVEAIACDTADWQAGGWSIPPSAQRVLYQAPALGPVARGLGRRRTETTQPTVARFILAGRPLPAIEDAVRIGELMRLATLAKFGRGDEGQRLAPAVVSGRSSEGKVLTDACHAHAFFLPEDADGDGKIDHIVVFVGGHGMDADVQSALDRVTRLWLGDRGQGDDEDNSGREEWRLALEGFGQPADFRESKLFGPARDWVSVTPYLRPWHAKRRFGTQQQLRRELVERGILSDDAAASVSVEILEQREVAGRPRRPLHFRRFRSRRGLTQPDKLGSFISLKFPTDVAGPLALGFGCHFGLGMFDRKGQDPRGYF